MPNHKLSFFKAFYSVVAEIHVTDDQLAPSKAEVDASVKNLDPIAANEVIQNQLKSLQPDKEVLELYYAVSEFQVQSFGEAFWMEETHPLVEAAWEIAIRLSGESKPTETLLTNLVDTLKQSMYDRYKVALFERYIANNAAALNEYRFKKLAEQVAQKENREQEDEVVVAYGEFTHTQQAIAIHYLFHEALDISGADNTRLMEFAHLLSAKKIPLNKETGKENIRNSGIKSAFNKAWKKEDSNHLADLRFVLLQAPVKLTTLRRFKLTRARRFKLTTPRRSKLTT